MYEEELLEDLELALDDLEDYELGYFEAEDLEAYPWLGGYAAEAAMAESAAEANMFIGSVLGSVPSLIRRYAPRLMRYTPVILRAARFFYRRLGRSPRTRRLLRYFPQILRRTIAVLSQMRVRLTFNVVLRTMVRVTASYGAGWRSRRWPYGMMRPPRRRRPAPRWPYGLMRPLRRPPRRPRPAPGWTYGTRRWPRRGAYGYARRRLWPRYRVL